MSGRIRHIILIIFMICGLSMFAQQNAATLKYIDKYKDLAMEHMVEYGIPASIKLAQAIIESSHGTSELAVKSNNHFCIKCHASWTGKKTYYDDDEKGECFRVYNSVEESYRDHSNFLKNGTRYASLFDLDITDYQGWAKGLKKAGYATSPVYATVLIKIIEDYNLQKYDQMVIKNQFKPKTDSDEVEEPDDEEEPKNIVKPKKVKKNKHTVADNTAPVPVLADCPVVEVTPDHHYIKENFGVKFITTKAGDNLESLAQELKMFPKQLVKYNHLDKNKTEFGKGEILYISPMRRKAPVGYYIHVIQPGETLSKVSKLYAVKLERLFKMNNLDENSILQIGQEIRLR